MKGALAMLVVCGSLVPGRPADAQDPSTPRQPTAVAAGIELTWESLRRQVRDDPNARALEVLEQGPAQRRGRWRTDIPSSDFRAGDWAVCRVGAEAGYAPRQGMFDVEVRGDSAASTILITARWSAEDPNQGQTGLRCSTSGKFEADAEKAIRSRAEKEQKRKRG